MNNNNKINKINNKMSKNNIKKIIYSIFLSKVYYKNVITSIY